MIPVATSIAPRNIDNQKQAIETWTEAGFRACSFNNHSEIEILEKKFPGVQFLPVERDGSDICGRPLVYLEDILAYFRDSEHDVFGFINSDIHFRVNPDFPEYVSRQVKDALLYGARIDVEHLDAREGKYYITGYDYFFLERNKLTEYCHQDFLIGMPWWDYFLPLLSILNGLEAKRIDSPIAFHIAHDANYSVDLFDQYATIFRNIIGEHPAASSLVKKIENISRSQAIEEVVEYLFDHSTSIHYP